jgi:conjugal transfer pilus assembly protein TraI
MAADSLALAKPADLLASVGQWMEALRPELGFTGPDFEALVAAPVLNLAAFTQMVPLPEDARFAQPGGAFRASVQLAFRAVQACHAKSFCGLESADVARRSEPKWRYAAFLAALCENLYRVATQVTVCDAASRQQWVPYAYGLLRWARSNQVERYQVAPSLTPPGESSRHLNALLSSHVVGAECMLFVAAAGTRVVEALGATLSDARHEGKGNLLTALLEQVRSPGEKIPGRDLTVQQGSSGLARRKPDLLEAGRALVAAGVWDPASKTGRIWVLGNDTFLLWPLGARDLLRSLAERGGSRWPADPEELAIALGEAEMLIARHGTTTAPCYYWSCIPPGKSRVVRSVKLAPCWNSLWSSAGSGATQGSGRAAG